MAGEAELLAEVEEILEDGAEVALAQDLLCVLARASALVSAYQDLPDTEENRAQLRQVYEGMAALAAALEGEVQR